MNPRSPALPPERRGNRSDCMAPHNNFPCRGDDAWVAIAVRSEDEWARMCGAMGRPQLADDPRFRCLDGRLNNLQELDAIVADWTRRRDSLEITQLLQAQSIPAAPVYKATDLACNPQLADRGFFQNVRHPDTGDFPYAGIGWRLSRTPGGLQGPAPRLGEHSVRILQDYLGMSRQDIDEWVSLGITGDDPGLAT